MNSIQDEWQQKIKIIRESLGARFHDVRPHNIEQARFFFHDAKRFFQFGFHRPTLEAVPLGQLRTLMDTKVITMIILNPGLQTFYGADGLSVREKVPN